MSTHNWWLGTPGAMQKLPQITNNVVEAPRSRSVQSTVTADGGTTTVALMDAKTAWALSWAYLSEQEADLIDSFADGLFGAGPFRLVDPTRRNVLSMDDSTMGLRSYAASRWVASSGPLTSNPTGGPAGLPSAALVWSSMPVGASLVLPSLTSTTNVDITAAPVLLADEAVSLSLYVKASTATSHFLQIAGYSATGLLTGTPLQVTIPVTTTWRRFAVTATPGYFGSAVFVSPRLVAGATSVSSLSVAAAQLEYGQVTDWQRGYGAPQVNITAAPGHSVPQFGYADKTLALAQC